jgi:hypothetical protein
MKQNEASKQVPNGQMELTIKAWESYANLEAAFDKAIDSAERNYQDKENWRLLRAEIEGFFSDVTRYLREAILNPTNDDMNVL